MKCLKCAGILGIAALLAAAAAAGAADRPTRQAAKEIPRVATAKAYPAPAPARSDRSETFPGMIGELKCAPAERMADTIAEFYASGKMRLYRLRSRTTPPLRTRP